MDMLVGTGTIVQGTHALGLVAGFVVLALGARQAEQWSAHADWAYPGPTMADPTRDEAPSTWLVDGFNVLHVALLRGERDDWWRAHARTRLVELAGALDDPTAEIVVVFDGRHPLPDGEGDSADGPRPRVVFASSADEWMLDALRGRPDPGSVAVVTADRKLAARARHRGAQVVAPGAFVERCRSPETG